MAKMTKEVFARYIEQYTLNMYRLAFSILRNSQDAEDAVSEAVLHAYEKLGTLKKEESFKPWILQITANESRKIYARNKLSPAVEWQDNLSPSFYDDYHELWDTVMNLEQAYRDVVILFYYEQMSLREIGKILHCKEGTVKSRLYRAKEKLRGMLA